MVRVRRRKAVRVIGLWVALFLISIAVVVVIDSSFALDPWGDEDAELLWWFLLGCFYFPGALRRYRADRQIEPKVPWCRRLDLIGCLLGLDAGLAFVLAVVQKWVWFVLAHRLSAPFPPNSLMVLEVVTITVWLGWLALFVLLCYERFKPIKPRKTVGT